MKHLIRSARAIAFFTVLTGLIYPALITGMAQAFFRNKANGEIVTRGGIPIGSRMIAQKFVSPNYFWGRPSSIDYNPLPSGGSNLGPTSAALKKTVDERAVTVRKAHGLDERSSVPQELLFASGSGLDPDIHPETALFQIARVAKARGLTQQQSDDLARWIQEHTQNPDLGFLGEPRVNVLELNLALDQMATHDR